MKNATLFFFFLNRTVFHIFDTSDKRASTRLHLELQKLMCEKLKVHFGVGSFFKVGENWNSRRMRQDASRSGKTGHKNLIHWTIADILECTSAIRLANLRGPQCVQRGGGHFTAVLFDPGQTRVSTRSSRRGLNSSSVWIVRGKDHLTGSETQDDVREQRPMAAEGFYVQRDNTRKRIFCIPAAPASPRPCVASPPGTVAGRPHPGSWSPPRPILSPCSLSPWQQACAQHMAAAVAFSTKQTCLFFWCVYIKVRRPTHFYVSRECLVFLSTVLLHLMRAAANISNHITMPARIAWGEISRQTTTCNNETGKDELNFRAVI